MIIGVPKEIKYLENRVGITPGGVDSLVRNGHRVLIEKDAGMSSGFTNEAYQNSGALIYDNVDKLWKESNLIVKVKEPLESEYKYFRDDLTIFTYLHLSGDKKLTESLLKSKAIAIAYETIQEENGNLPLLTPMSEIAGKVATQHGAIYLESGYGGLGKLLDGAPGVPPAHVVVIGAGVAGKAAIQKAVCLGARVTAVDLDINKLRYLQEAFYGKVETLYSNSYNITQVLKTADLVIGAVLIPGAKAPKVISEEMIKQMKPGSVIMDISIDQGGCVETINEESLKDAKDYTFIKHGVLHSAVPNIPSKVAQTATIALTNATIPYIINMANKSIETYLKENSVFKKGVNIYKGKLTHKSVAESLDLEYTDLDSLIQ